MSRNFAVLGKSNLAMPPARYATAAETAAPGPGVYAELIRKVFDESSVVAVVGSGGADAAAVCDGIAAEVAASSGKRVVVVAADRLMDIGSNSLPDTNPDKPAPESGFISGTIDNVWHWPAPSAHQLRFFKPPAHERPGPPDSDKWLDPLRRNFDSVLLSCRALEPEESEPVTGIAAAAEMAVLVVEAGRSTKKQILRDQRALQSRGVKLAGCVLVHRK
jgi:hypothetical protein